MSDFEREKVPSKDALSWGHIALVYVGVAITIPAFLLVANITLSLGYTKAILAILLSSLILSVFAVLTGVTGSLTRLSSYMIISHVFGENCSKYINILFSITLAGWFGVTLSFFALAAENIMSIGYQKWLIIGTILMTLTAIYGFKGLHTLSLIAVPLMLLLLYGFSLMPLRNIPYNDILSITGTQEISFGAAVSMLVGGMMVGVAIFPDLTRYTKSVKDGIISGVVSFMFMIFIALPIMIPVLYYKQTNIVDIMQNSGYQMLALIIIILASWSSNDNNLYSGSLSLATILKNIPKNKIVLGIALLGYVCASLNITANFIMFLTFLSSIIPPIAAIYSVDCLILKNKSKRKDTNKKALTAWILGVLTALATSSQQSGGLELLNLTYIPALDGYFISIIIYYLINRYHVT